MVYGLGLGIIRAQSFVLSFFFCLDGNFLVFEFAQEQSETAVESHNLPGGCPASGGHLSVLRGLPSLDKGYELGFGASAPAATTASRPAWLFSGYSRRFLEQQQEAGEEDATGDLRGVAGPRGNAGVLKGKQQSGWIQESPGRAASPQLLGSSGDRAPLAGKRLPHSQEETGSAGL